MERTIDTVIKDLQNIIDVQCASGNWNYDPYMLGLANGLIMAKSIMTGEEPEFLTAPEKWLKDVKIETTPIPDYSYTDILEGRVNG